MSERILEALMQLFAIMARPDISSDEKRSVVSSFLLQQLNQEIVDKYLKVFDSHFSRYQQRYSDTKRALQNYSVSAVKVLKIGNQINGELTHQQKIVVLIRLLEFAKAEDEISSHEKEVIDTIADVFHINPEEYKQIVKFVVHYFDEPDDIEDILLIDNLKSGGFEFAKHIYISQLKGQIKIYQIRSAGLYILNFFGENELFLNGQFLKPTKVYMLSPGSSIRNPQIKPIYYSDIVNTFNIDTSKDNTIFEANDIEYQFTKEQWGFKKMTFVERSGRMVGIMGASGTGKTTLLNVLNGTNPPTKGEIRINGTNIHHEKDKTKGIIGYVSQDDLLIEELSVFENLYYNAKLSFSKLSKNSIIEKVNALLINLGLYDIRNYRVGSVLNKIISGGQRKRLNIALELIREPTVLFLDEPTSGLSSRDSENIMDLLKELTLKGKLVFVVIHQPSSAIFKMFDRLYVLDQGGYLIYRGDPVESISYFKSRVHQVDWNDAECHVCGNVNPEQIFNIIEAEVVDEFGKLTHTRKVLPKEWNESFKRFIPKTVIKEEDYQGLPPVSFQPPNWWKQVRVFVQRDFKAKWANRGALFLNILLAPLLAVMLSYIIKYYNVADKNVEYVFAKNSNFPVYLFIAVIVAIFMGLTGSAQEIIRDRKILKRERFLDLSWSSYLVSKLTILLAIAGIQAFLFVLFGNAIMDVKGMFLPYWAVLFSIWAFGVILGLNVSDGVQKEVTIYILIPFLIIPQIILSGVIIKYDKLNPNISSPETIPWYGEIMAARWGYEALAVHQFVYNEYERPIYHYEKQISQAQYKKDWWIARLKSAVHFVKQNYAKKKRTEEVLSKLEMLKLAIPEEQRLNTFLKVDTTSLNLDNERFLVSIKQLDQELETLKLYYKSLFREANNKKEEIALVYESEGRREEYIQLKKDHLNEKMRQMLKNTDLDNTKIMNYKGRLIQKVDPIFKDPEHPFLRAHFFSPRKKVGSYYVETLWANVITLWAMFVLLYLFLFVRLFRGMSDMFRRNQILRRFIKPYF